MAEQRRILRLGELMVQQGLITQDQLRIAMIEQEQNNFAAWPSTSAPWFCV